MNEWSEGMLVKSMQTRAEVCREDQTVITFHVLAPLGMVAHSNSSNLLVSFFGNNACTSQSLVTESTTLPSSTVLDSMPALFPVSLSRQYSHVSDTIFLALKEMILYEK